jgi:hypothetical protein
MDREIKEKGTKEDEREDYRKREKDIDNRK